VQALPAAHAGASTSNNPIPGQPTEGPQQHTILATHARAVTNHATARLELGNRVVQGTAGGAAIEREPITDANRDAALAGPDITESQHEVTLHAERPVVEKQTVPVERVRLDKETVTDEQTVGDEVRKEQIDTDTPDR
jgi:hypothetical protein